jgi:D-alanyl-D-alanine dipeptidase
LHGYRLDKGPVKREGDGRAPAGVFALPFLFGEGADRFRYPYRRMGNAHRCVDDRRSRFYNRIVEQGKVERDWRSAERMKFPSGLYRYGIFVAHNPRNVPGGGSCIFLHIKKPSGKPTVGCTAMSRKELVTVMQWLDPALHPVLVQGPESAMKKLLPANLQLTQLR